jgi:tyrosine-protein phosphatase YwqE
VASDAHSSSARPPLLAAAKARIEHIAGHIEAQAMFEERPRAVLRNRPVSIQSPLPSTPRTISDMVERLATLL